MTTMNDLPKFPATSPSLNAHSVNLLEPRTPDVLMFVKDGHWIAADIRIPQRQIPKADIIAGFPDLEYLGTSRRYRFMGTWYDVPDNELPSLFFKRKP